MPAHEGHETKTSKETHTENGHEDGRKRLSSLTEIRESLSNIENTSQKETAPADLRAAELVCAISCGVSDVDWQHIVGTTDMAARHGWVGDSSQPASSVPKQPQRTVRHTYENVRRACTRPSASGRHCSADNGDENGSEDASCSAGIKTRARSRQVKKEPEGDEEDRQEAGCDAQPIRTCAGRRTRRKTPVGGVARTAVKTTGTGSKAKRSQAHTLPGKKGMVS